MKHLLLMFTSLLIVAGCSSSRSKQKLQCNEVDFIDAFPKEICLESSHLLSLDLAGCVDVFSVDTLMIFKVMDGECFWKVYSLNDYRLLGNYLTKGHGKDEFVDLPCSELVMKTDTALYCDFWCPSKMMWFRCDLTKTLQDGRPVWEQQKRFDNNDNVTSVLCLSDTSFFILKNKDYVGYVRGLFENGTDCDLSHIGNLNEMEIEEDINTLSAVCCLNRERMMMAEGMLRLNQINLYSLATGYSKTVCVGKKLSDVDEVDHRPKKMRHKYYGNILSYDDYFVALYHDISAMDYWMGTGKSELQFFDWTGRPLLCLKLPFMASSFFVSQNRYVYAFSAMEDEEVLYKYDCGEVLQSIIKYE